MRRLALAGLLATLAAVVVLAASLVAGLGGGGDAGWDGAPREPDALPERRVRVEVLNAAGAPGLARAVTERLRDEGFDVVYYGNAPASFGRDTSVVIDRIGDPAAAHEVAGALGIGRVSTIADTTLYLEATVVVGRDWAGLRGEPVDGASPADSAA